MAKFAIGVDFGTESGRAVLVDVATGQEVATAVHEYSDGVIDDHLPHTSIKIEPATALQNPADYIAVFRNAIPAVLSSAKVTPGDLVGVGIDFTSCTILPIDSKAMPLCLLKQWKDNPHSWVKLWKHHAAQDEADRINETARNRGEEFLARYGGKYSSEWFFSKVLQVLNDSPDLYDAADRFMEGADWVILELTGEEKRNLCAAGYKAMWDKEEGFPSDDFFAALHPKLRNVIDDKMTRDYYPLGGKAGEITKRAASITGLLPGTAVAVGNVDAHAAVPAATVTEPGRMVMIMGTSICHMVLGLEKKMVEGMCGVTEDGIIPGFFGYEAGQSGVGDIFAWFMSSCVPADLHDEARRSGRDMYQLLEEKAARLRPGQTGLLALDWWSGNRSVLVDHDLKGLILGMDLSTKPEEIYRALMEATAFGTRVIIEAFEKSGVEVREIVACGGLPDKNKLLMQIYADVTGREFKVAASSQASALGAAMHGAVAAGRERGGYDTIVEAAEKMAGLRSESYVPDPGAHRIYDKIFAEYIKLHDYFGRGANDVIKRLRSVQ